VASLGHFSEQAFGDGKTVHRWLEGRYGFLLEFYIIGWGLDLRWDEKEKHG
jgi:hypothetical protein